MAGGRGGLDKSHAQPPICPMRLVDAGACERSFFFLCSTEGKRKHTPVRISGAVIDGYGDSRSILAVKLVCPSTDSCSRDPSPRHQAMADVEAGVEEILPLPARSALLDYKPGDVVIAPTGRGWHVVKVRWEG